jgi:hypothetical protein
VLDVTSGDDMTDDPKEPETDRHIVLITDYLTGARDLTTCLSKRLTTLS